MLVHLKRGQSIKLSEVLLCRKNKLGSPSSWQLNNLAGSRHYVSAANDVILTFHSTYLDARKSNQKSVLQFGAL